MRPAGQVFLGPKAGLAHALAAQRSRMRRCFGKKGEAGYTVTMCRWENRGLFLTARCVCVCVVHAYVCGHMRVRT